MKLFGRFIAIVSLLVVGTFYVATNAHAQIFLPDENPPELLPVDLTKPSAPSAPPSREAIANDPYCTTYCTARPNDPSCSVCQTGVTDDNRADSVNIGNPLDSNFATGGTTERLGNTAVETVQNRLARLLSTMLRGIAALSLLPIVVGGFQMIISQGSEDKVARGKQTLYFGVVGLFLALVAIAFFQTMLSFLNFTT